MYKLENEGDFTWGGKSLGSLSNHIDLLYRHDGEDQPILETGQTTRRDLSHTMGTRLQIKHLVLHGSTL